MAYKDSPDYDYMTPDDFRLSMNRAPTTGPQQFGVQNPEQPIEYGAPAPQTPPSQGGAPAPNGAAPPAQGGVAAAGGGSPLAFIQQWQASHPASEGIAPLADALTAAGFQTPRFMYGNTPSNNELVVNGQKFKVLGGEDSPSSSYWYTGGDDSAPGSGGGGGTPGVRGEGGSGAYVSGQGVPGMGTVFGGGGLGDDANPLFNFLMERAHQGINVDAKDPIIRQNVDAYNATQQRAERDYESKLAERLGANTNMGKERRMGAERIGSATSAFEAQMLNAERQARRQEVQQALEGSRGLLTAEQSMRLQEELAQLGLAENAYQFDVNDQFRNSPLYGG